MIKFDVRYFMPYLLSSVDRLPSDRRLAYDVVGKIFISYPRPFRMPSCALPQSDNRQLLIYIRIPCVIVQTYTSRQMHTIHRATNLVHSYIQRPRSPFLYYCNSHSPSRFYAHSTTPNFSTQHQEVFCYPLALPIHEAARIPFPLPFPSLSQ